MIRQVSELLEALMKEEREKLDEYSLKHGPTIGKMYEGLTSELLGRVIPSSLNLQVHHGIIHDGNGLMSGEIDCMLVKGQGENIPYTDSYKWHIRDVVAVVEVKKTLYSADLRDAFTHLRGVVDSYASYIKSGDGGETFNIEPARKAFSETTGLVAPDYSNVAELGIEMETLFHLFVTEHLSPIRIVLGYHGFKKESSLRKSLLDFLEENKMTQGFGVGSFPQLIVCGDYSLVKLNGYPYSAPMQNSFWNFYVSSITNPVHLILELVWTRLSYEISIADLWGEDLGVENFSMYLSGRIIAAESHIGWEYDYTEISDAILADRIPELDWSPVFVSNLQFVIFNRLCSEGELNIDNKETKDYVESKGLEYSEFIESLTRTGLIAIKNNKMELTTFECSCSILPDGRCAVAENNTGRLSRWLERYMDNRNA